ncbi:MAG: inositol monophosphatase [Gammaproteobacteria bacterium]|nr:inositol monophosphatase [Gammaproteobacteria bacterium]
MKLPRSQELCAIVKQAAIAELLPRFATVDRKTKQDGSIVTEADHAIQTRLTGELRQRWPEYALMGEEMSSAEQAGLLANPGAGLWIVDPLDGTSNFAAGIPYYAVSVALMRAGELVLGVVYDPARDECFSAEVGGGARLNGEPLAPVSAPASLQRAIAAIDFKRLPTELVIRLVHSSPYHSQRSFGSIALDWCWVAAGRFDIFLHGKQNIWDYAAGHLILSEAGGQACSFGGNPVFSARGEPRSALAALDDNIFEHWRAWLLG